MYTDKYSKRSSALLDIQKQIKLVEDGNSNIEVEVILSEANTLAILAVAEHLKGVNQTLRSIGQKYTKTEPAPLSTWDKVRLLSRKIRFRLKKLLQHS